MMPGPTWATRRGGVLQPADLLIERYPDSGTEGLELARSTT
jgi:hypothetical protein